MRASEIMNVVDAHATALNRTGMLLSNHVVRGVN